MKRKMSVILTMLMLILAIAPLGSFAAPEEPLQFVADEAYYLDGQTKLMVKGHYVNIGNRNIADVVETYLEVYNDGTLVAQGTYKKTVVDKYYILIGNRQKSEIVMDNPVQNLKLTKISAISKVMYNADDSMTLPAGKKVYYNGSQIVFDVPPAVINGRLMVPARATFEKMGATVEWNAESRSVTVKGKSKNVVLFIDNTTMTVDGNPVKLDAPAQIIEGRTLVPLRAISSALGDKILYGSANEMAVIYSTN